MGILVNGSWQIARPEATDRSGAFVRPDTQFRWRVSADGSSGFKAEPDRYHLYVSLACPWAHRTLIFRVLKKLDGAIGISIVAPLMLENGWEFGAKPDPVTGARFLHEIYTQADPRYTGRASVPVLWDKERHTIVNNESAEIIRMLNREFDAFADRGVDLYPAALAAEIDAINARVYAAVNNGVYRAGFATTEAAYRGAVSALFAMLDELEERLARQRYLAGDRITEADWRLFTTLIRFDAVYYGHFKCNLRHLYEYPQLWDLTRALYQVPGVAETVDFDHIKRHYYGSHRHINPTGIVPVGPRLDLRMPSSRG